MVGAPRSRRRSDPVLLAEAALVILLIVLFLFLYARPSQDRLTGLSWWSPVLLGGVALGVLLVDRWRRRRRYRREMQEMKEEQLGKDR